MQVFHPRETDVLCESVSLTRLAAEYGTPCFVYSGNAIDHQCRTLREAFHEHPTLLCYAVKANTTRAILTRIFSHGLGADVVSGGELERALRAGAVPAKIVFSGVGKLDWEIELALEKGIGAFNVESIDELRRIDTIARRMEKTPSVLLRVNPNIPVETNPYIATGLYTTKFGIAEADLAGAVQQIANCPSLRLRGLSCHLGSQIADLETFRQAAKRVTELTGALKAHHPEIDRVNLGGGLAVRYHREKPPAVRDYAQVLIEATKQAGLHLVLEPGRWIVAESGGLLTRVTTVKSTPQKNFAVVDAGMNDLIRPSLYEAYHPVMAVAPRAGDARTYDIVGPVCETGDFLALERSLPPLHAGDLLLVGVCGAYGSVMSSHYNSRPRIAEIWVERSQSRVIRLREPLENLWSLEI